MKNQREILEREYELITKHGYENAKNKLSADVEGYIEVIADRAEYNKGVMTVLLTSLVQKIFDPTQDVRKHQANMDGGYSGRSIDTKLITPFMKAKKLPSMSESGWLTRSLEQPRPYTLDYRGKVTPKVLKKAFLHILDAVENKPSIARPAVQLLLGRLIEKHDTGQVKVKRIPKTEKYSIAKIIDLLEAHFSQSGTAGTARLPVIAVHSVYEVMVKELGRFDGKELKALASHTSPDMRSGDIGDVQVNNSTSGEPFEGVEIKYGKEIDYWIVSDAYEKLKTHPVDRYYILSTKKIKDADLEKVGELIAEVSMEHGCQIIVNGLIQSIKYYLRLISNTNDFLENYAKNLESDEVIKAEHKLIWNDLIS